MNIETFDDLLASARQQTTAQRLLFVFAGSEMPEDATDEQRARFEAGLGGALVPMIEVDKLPDEINGFDQLVDESTQFAQGHVASDWSIVFVAALAGQGDVPPSTADAEAALRSMTGDIRRGMVRPFLTFDRQGLLVKLVQGSSQ